MNGPATTPPKPPLHHIIQRVTRPAYRLLPTGTDLPLSTASVTAADIRDDASRRCPLDTGHHEQKR